MDYSKINPFIRVAMHHMRLDDFSVVSEWHQCYDCRVFYILKGDGHISLKTNDHKISPDTLIYLPPGTRYRFIMSPDFQYFTINFDLTDSYSHIKESLGVTYDGFDESKMPKYGIPLKFSQAIIHKSHRLHEPLKKCVDEFLSATPYYRDIASASLKSCLMELLRERDLEYEYIVASKALNYVRENYQNAALSNTDIAEHFGYHPYYLSNLVKEATGMSLRQYIIHHRLRMAKNLLRTTNLDMVSIAEQSGFHSVTYFNKQFKEHNGLTPLAYRKAHMYM